MASKSKVPEGSRIPDGTLSPEDIERFKMAFKVVAGSNSEIEVDELRKMLNDIFKSVDRFDGFSRETCRSIVALYDDNLNGRLGFGEALEFWARLRLWTKIFRRFDIDRNGFFHSNEWQDLLNALGHNLSEKVSKALHTRHADREGRVHFNEYIACMLKLTAMIDAFKGREVTGGDGQATFKADEFIQLTVYA